MKKKIASGIAKVINELHPSMNIPGEKSFSTEGAGTEIQPAPKKQSILMMEQEVFDRLLSQGRVSEILMQGGINLTKKQIETVKEYSKQESAEVLERRKMEVASKPGYREFMTMPLLSKVMASAGGGQIPQQNQTAKPETTQAEQAQPEQTDQNPKDKKDPHFTSIGPKNTQNLRVKDTEADVIAKMYNFMQRKQQFEKEKHDDLQQYYKKRNLEKEQRTEDIIAALLGETPRKIAGVKTSSKIKSETQKESKKKTGPNLLKMGAFGAIAAGGVLLADKAFASISKIQIPDFGDIGKKPTQQTTPQAPADTPPIGKLHGLPGDPRNAAESYLGRGMSDREWDLLLRATAAEASANKEEQTVVAASILNRVRKKGTDVETELARPFQFQAYTGLEGRGYNPSRAFVAGPGTRMPSILESMRDLPRVSHEQINFQSAIPEAYTSKQVGEQKIEQKRKEGYVTVGKSIANVGIGPPVATVPPTVTAAAPKPTYEQKDVQSEAIDKLNSTWQETIDMLERLEQAVSKISMVTVNKVVNNNTNLSTRIGTINDTPALMQKQ